MAFHLYRINEVYSNADGTVQFIELRGELNGQNLLTGHTITVTRGGTIHSYTFPNNLPSTTTLGKSVLIATQGFADLGIVTPDYIIPDGFLFTNGGTVTFPADLLTHDIHPYPSLPTGGTNSLNQNGVAGPSSPTNFAGVTGTIVVGTGGPDNLTGGAGNDAISGGAGNDTLTGGAGNDRLSGEGGNDILNGGTGNDRMIGGAGNDIYVRNATGDVVTEGANAGTDTVQSAVTYTLGANVEKLTLTGAGAINGTGNTLANTLTGNTGKNVLNGLGGNDTLNGGLGNDTMIGGTGNDTYVRNATGDVVTEGVNAGTDTVQSGVTYTLGANLEKLTLTGAGVINGTGNTLHNVLTGNTAKNILNGGAGNDTLNGGAGNDTMIGGSGNDTLVWDAADRSIKGGIGTDTLRVDGAGKVVNLTTVPDTRITDVEVINLTGSGNNTLNLAAADVLAINAGHTLRVAGDAADAVFTEDAWTEGAVQTIAGNDYTRYTNGAAILLVDTDILFNSINLSALDASEGFALNGYIQNRPLGSSVAGAGDVNGDGIDDFIIGASDNYSGQSYVVFGRDTGSFAGIDLSNLGGTTNGFVLNGEAALDFAGYSVSGAGDVNGDGFGDVIVGANGAAGPNGSNFAGASYVVFGNGTPSSTDLPLSTLDGSSGFKLNGVSSNTRSGTSVSGAGDVNGDGFDDIIVGSPSGAFALGHAYVVFGKASGFTADLDLSALNGTNGFKIDGVIQTNFGDQTGRSVSAAGDVNGDGFDDVLVGAPYALNNVGQAYVIYGKNGGFNANVDLGTLNAADGVLLAASGFLSRTGFSVSDAGDVNGDGVGDMIVGAWGDGNLVGAISGASYVVFGVQGGLGGQVNLADLDGDTGFRILGVAEDDRSGRSVSGAGDVNGDGDDDLIIGADQVDSHAPIVPQPGQAYLVFGKAGGFAADMDLSTLSSGDGRVFVGGAAGDLAGHSVSGAGDINGDGFDDLIVSAPGADGQYLGNNLSNNGASYVVFGQDFRNEVDFTGTAGNDDLAGTAAAEILIGGLGNDTLDGAGGVDVLRGAAGNDTLVFDGLDRLVDGGLGTDSLLFSGSGQSLDLTGISNLRYTGIEVIDLTGSGNNDLTLALGDLLDLSDSTNTLRVDGDTLDTVTAGSGWTPGADQVLGLQTYHTYTQGAATLLVDTDVGIFI